MALAFNITPTSGQTGDSVAVSGTDIFRRPNYISRELFTQTGDDTPTSAWDNSSPEQGLFGKTFVGNGSDAWVQKDMLVTSGDAVSFAFWFKMKTATVSGFEYLMATDDDSTGAFPITIAIRDYSGAQTIQVNHEQFGVSSLRWQFEHGISDLTEWNHVIYTWDGNSSNRPEIYINNVSKSVHETNGPGVCAPNTTETIVFGDRSSAAYPLDGYVSDFYYMSAVWDATERSMLSSKPTLDIDGTYFTLSAYSDYENGVYEIPNLGFSNNINADATLTDTSGNTITDNFDYYGHFLDSTSGQTDDIINVNSKLFIDRPTYTNRELFTQTGSDIPTSGWIGSTTQVQAKIGKGAYVDGSSDYIFESYTGSVGNIRSYSIWIKPIDTSNNGPAFALTGARTSDGYRAYVDYIQVGGDNTLIIYNLTNRVSGGNSYRTYHRSTTPLVDDVWTNVVFSFNADTETLTMWINGTSESLTKNSDALVATSDSSYIRSFGAYKEGTSDGTWKSFWEGNVSDFYYFEYLPSQAQVNQFANLPDLTLDGNSFTLSAYSDYENGVYSVGNFGLGDITGTSAILENSTTSGNIPFDYYSDVVYDSTSGQTDDVINVTTKNAFERPDYTNRELFTQTGTDAPISAYNGSSSQITSAIIDKGMHTTTTDGDYVYIGDNYINGSSFSISMWVRRNSNDGSSTTLLSCSDTDSNPPLFRWQILSDDKLYYTLELDATPVSKKRSNRHQLTMDTDWHHYALVWDGTDNFATMYFDGVLLTDSLSEESLGSVVGGGLTGQCQIGSIRDGRGTSDADFCDCYIANNVIWTSAEVSKLATLPDLTLDGNSFTLSAYSDYENGTYQIPQLGLADIDGASMVISNSTTSGATTFDYKTDVVYDSTSGQTDDVINVTTKNAFERPDYTNRELFTQTGSDVPTSAWQAGAVQTNGIIGYALESNGSDQCVKVNNTFAPTSNFSVGAFVYLNSFNGTNAIFRDGNAYTGDTAQGLQIYIEGTTGYIVVNISDPGGVNGSNGIKSDSPVVLNEWFHIAVIGDTNTASTFKIYIDGVEFPSSVFATGGGDAYEPTTNEYAIGGIPVSSTTYGGCVDGKICDFYLDNNKQWSITDIEKLKTLTTISIGTNIKTEIWSDYENGIYQVPQLGLVDIDGASMTISNSTTSGTTTFDYKTDLATSTSTSTEGSVVSATSKNFFYDVSYTYRELFTQTGNDVPTSAWNGGVTQIQGKRGKGFENDGASGSFIRMSDALTLGGSNGLSIGAWIKFDEVSGENFTIFALNTSASGGGDESIRFVMQGVNRFWTELRTDASNIISTLQKPNTSQSPQPTNLSWVHVAMVWDGTHAVPKVYLDGQLSTESTTSVDNQGDISNATFSGYCNLGSDLEEQAGSTYLGKMSDLYVYNGQWSQEDILKLAHQPKLYWDNTQTIAEVTPTFINAETIEYTIPE